MKGLILTLGQRQAVKKLIMIWRGTGILPNLTCCRLKPGVLLQDLSFPTSPEMLCKSQTTVPEVRNLPLAMPGVCSLCDLMLELFTEMFILKDITVKGQCLFKLEYTGTSAKKKSNLEICEDTQSSFSCFAPNIPA